MKKTLQILNLIAFTVTIYFNYASSAGVFNNKTQADISATYQTLFTPAGYAFAIWGLIYLLLFGFIIYQSRSLFVKVRDDSFILKTGWWFILSCIANSVWCYLFVTDYIGLSVLVIFFLLFCLLKIVVKNSMELWDAPISVITFLWWPFVIYSGWLTVACIANVAAYLVKIGWDGFGISHVIWTCILIVIATVINLLITWKRNMREFALVGAWALVAIAVANWNTQETVKYIALISAGMLVLSSSIHAFINRDTNPAIKCLEYFKKPK
ncbi:tryptophan-rich sensory protein [Patiriisocius hiemis]|uniref:Tryptophan-rich sensory protein n=1 Tax=Patiriisocius hiemis TaxID=3075604 RepID=A0ABU2YC93_9FLAO|nr:tryptophan-rich sensory protein [Constantimarinum sp. W242]MDT0555377.1 tryptophan-rich sensory protein [Constantimarinum sp. W242]